MFNQSIPRIFIVCFLATILSLPTYAQQGHKIQTGVDILPAKETSSARFNIMYGHRIAPRITASIGTGLTFYHDPLSLVPVFIDLKYAPSLFFIGLKAGYNISILTDTNIPVDDHDGGFILNPALGMTIPTEAGFAFTLSVGYSIEKASFSRDDPWRDRTVETDITYKRLMAGIGFTF